jgi:hypothetical protein
MEEPNCEMGSSCRLWEFVWVGDQCLNLAASMAPRAMGNVIDMRDRRPYRV